MADAGPVVAPAPVGPAAPAARGIEAAGSARDGRGTGDTEARGSSDEIERRRASRELWARDMAVRAARAAGPPKLDPLPTYSYRVGPDGKPYATGDPPIHHARATSTSESPDDDAVSPAQGDDAGLRDITSTARARGDPEPPVADASTIDVETATRGPPKVGPRAIGPPADDGDDAHAAIVRRAYQAAASDAEPLWLDEVA